MSERIHVSGLQTFYVGGDVMVGTQRGRVTDLGVDDGGCYIVFEPELSGPRKPYRDWVREDVEPSMPSAVAAAPAFKFQRGPRITTSED